LVLPWTRTDRKIAFLKTEYEITIMIFVARGGEREREREREGKPDT